MTHREPNYYVELESKIAALSRQRDELLDIAARSRLEQGYAFFHGLPKLEDIAPIYLESANRLAKEIDVCKAQLPCYVFIRRFSFWLHEEYHVQHPLNSQTELRNMPPSGEGVYYRVLLPGQMLKYSRDMSVPASVMESENYIAKWEPWRDEDASTAVIWLAYNPHDNVIYVAN